VDLETTHHLRTELVVDALEIPEWARKPAKSLFYHSDIQNPGVNVQLDPHSDRLRVAPSPVSRSQHLVYVRRRLPDLRGYSVDTVSKPEESVLVARRLGYRSLAESKEDNMRGANAA